jgi:primosomal protein N' (replication factor Y)
MGEEAAEVIVRINHPRLGHVFHYRVPEDMDKPQPGVRVRVPFGKRVVDGWVIGYGEPGQGIKLRKIKEIIGTEPDFTEEMLQLAYWMAGYYMHPLGEILDLMSPPETPKKPLKLLIPEKLPQQPDITFELTAEQKAAIKKIKEALNKKVSSRCLLYGVTGSGKTEVYLHAARAALDNGCQVLYLVPEISLTPRMNAIFQEWFGEAVAVWHHRLTGREKYRAWEGIKNGSLKVLIGPRSAVFAPFRNLGLIIIDEEHDPAYKQQEKPHYHARQIALWRGRYNNAVIVLGSATPSLESYTAAAGGTAQLLTIRKRPPGRRLPVISVVDMKEEVQEGNLSSLSRYLVEQIRLRLARKEQVILFLNRRGYAPLVFCQECGEVLKCENCSISLIYHKQSGDLRCHYCNARKPILKTCPSCGSKKRMRFLGTGIQRVEKELNEILPDSRVLRMDYDTTRKKGAFQQILGGFSRREADILLGTQMVAKGHNFPGVTLVGILNADLSLNLPDFRSAEHTFQLLTQVAGRAGRGSQPGEVVVQTICPDHYSISAACLGEDQCFYKKEIQRRRSLGYPPFGELIRVRLSGEDEEKVLSIAAQLAQDLRSVLDSDQITVLGPAPASILRVKGYYRYQVMLKGKCRHQHKRIEQCLGVYHKNNSVIISVEVDPFGF